MEMVIQVIVGGIAARQFVGKMLQTKIARAIFFGKIDFTLLFGAPAKKNGLRQPPKTFTGRRRPAESTTVPYPRWVEGRRSNVFLVV